MFFLSLVLQRLISTAQCIELLNGCYLLYNYAYPNTSPICYLESALLPKVRQFLSHLISHLIVFYCRLSNHCTIPGITLSFYLYFRGFSNVCSFLVYDSSTCHFYQVMPVSSIQSLIQGGICTRQPLLSQPRTKT